jgi:clan AA aspartic protease (TIGR02281 family)
MNYLKNLLILSLFFISKLSFSQNVYSKDGVSLGDKKIIVDACIIGFNSQLEGFDKIKFKPEKYCSCVCDNLIPTLHSEELNNAIFNNNFDELLMDNNNIGIVLDCLNLGEMDLKEDSTNTSIEKDNIMVKVGVKTCVNEIMSDESTKGIFTQEIAEKYCDCAMNKIFGAGFSFETLKELENENSESYNEIILPCLTDILDDIQYQTSSNTYIEKDIKGEILKSEVPLIDYLGQGYKIKISIGGISKYFLFDTGASDMIIDKETEKELQKLGVLKPENYLYKTDYQLANKKMVKAQVVIVDNVTIGDYTLNNVIIAILNEGSLLCGKSFLDKFENWELDKKNKLLILYK